MEDTDKILQEELGNIGDEWGGIGAGIGATWAAGRLPNNAFAASVELDLSTARALAELEDAARRLGRVIGRDVSDSGASLKFVIGAGFWNLNPAVVDVHISSLDDGRCRVVITGTAKEGLIKQRAGEG